MFTSPKCQKSSSRLEHELFFQNSSSKIWHQNVFWRHRFQPRALEPHKARDSGASASKTTSQPATNLLPRRILRDFPYRKLSSQNLCLHHNNCDPRPIPKHHHVFDSNLSTTSPPAPKASRITSHDEGKKRMIKEEDGFAKRHKMEDSIEEVCQPRMILHTCLPPKASRITSHDEGKKRMIKEEDGLAKRHKTEDSIEEVCRPHTILHTCLHILA